MGESGPAVKKNNTLSSTEILVRFEKGLAPVGSEVGPAALKGRKLLFSDRNFPPADAFWGTRFSEIKGKRALGTGSSL